jgi:hypothetical protein
MALHLGGLPWGRALISIDWTLKPPKGGGLRKQAV